MAAKKKSAKKGVPAHTPGTESAAAAAAAADPENEGGRPQVQELGLTGDGVARPEVPALDEACRDYVKYRDKRQEAGLKEVTNKKLVIAIMEKHSLASYEVDDLVFKRVPKDETASLQVVHKADYTGAPQPKDTVEV